MHLNQDTKSTDEEYAEVVTGTRSIQTLQGFVRNLKYLLEWLMQLYAGQGVVPDLLLAHC